MTLFRKLYSLKHLTNVVANNPFPILLATSTSSRSALLLARPSLHSSLLHSSAAQQAEYKTPTNRQKIFRPTSVPVTKQNQHLEIDLSDENGKELGRVSMKEASELAKSRNLRLAIVDESTSPPKFRLLEGKELARLQMQAKQDGATGKEVVHKMKEVQINLGIADHDLEIKTKMANNFLEKGHDVNILIKSRGHDMKVSVEC